MSRFVVKFSICQVDPQKKKIFLIAVISALVIGAIVVAVVLGGKSKDGLSFGEKPQTAETDANGNPVVTDPSGNGAPNSGADTSKMQDGGADTTPGFGELIRP